MSFGLARRVAGILVFRCLTCYRVCVYRLVDRIGQKLRLGPFISDESTALYNPKIFAIPAAFAQIFVATIFKAATIKPYLGVLPDGDANEVGTFYLTGDRAMNCNSFILFSGGAHYALPHALAFLLAILSGAAAERLEQALRKNSRF